MRAPDETVRSFLSAFAEGDPDRIAGHVAPSFVNEHASLLGEGCEGRDEYRRRLPTFLASMPDIRYHVDALVADGGTVAVTYRLTAEPDDGPIEVRGSMWFEVDDDLIRRRTDYWDSAPFLDAARDGSN